MEPYRKRSRNWKSGQGPTKGCRATDRQMKAQLFPHLIKHQAMTMTGGTVLCIFNIDTGYCEWSASRLARFTAEGRVPPNYPLDTRLDGPSRQYGYWREKRTLTPLPAIESRFLGYLAPCLVAISREFSRPRFYETSSNTCSAAAVHINLMIHWKNPWQCDLELACCSY
jgi:hypothetical protein